MHLLIDDRVDDPGAPNQTEVHRCGCRVRPQVGLGIDVLHEGRTYRSDCRHGRHDGRGREDCHRGRRIRRTDGVDINPSVVLGDRVVDVDPESDLRCNDGQESELLTNRPEVDGIGGRT